MNWVLNFISGILVGSTNKYASFYSTIVLHTYGVFFKNFRSFTSGPSSDQTQEFWYHDDECDSFDNYGPYEDEEEWEREHGDSLN